MANTHEVLDGIKEYTLELIGTNQRDDAVRAAAEAKDYRDGAEKAADRAEATSEYNYRGSGMPEGKVVAPVGSVYTDTDSTAGALRWIKTSGDGNTGWKVEYGDTGWRTISVSMPGHISGYIEVRRVGPAVYVNIANFKAEDQATSWNQWDGFIPLGFRPGATVYFPFSARNSNFSEGPIRFNASGNIYMYAAGGQKQFDGNVVFLTPDTWPSTRPGTPS